MTLEQAEQKAAELRKAADEWWARPTAREDCDRAWEAMTSGWMGPAIICTGCSLKHAAKEAAEEVSRLRNQ